MPDHIGEPSADTDLEHGRALLLAAFEQARTSGQTNWASMTTAVLKNRLLDITGRKFNEGQFQVSSMAGFARLFPDQVEVDTSTRPSTVRLMRPDDAPSVGKDVVEDRVPTIIRPDLWRATVDYRSGVTYVWDDDQRRACTAGLDDIRPVMPTLTEREVQAWRQEFANSISTDLDDRDHERLEEWRDKQYGTMYLPAHLRGPWNRHFRGKVRQRLVDFFADKSIPAPDDIESPAHTRREASNALTDLRAVVHECVAVMTAEELSDLRLSPAVILRARRGRT